MAQFGKSTSPGPMARKTMMARTGADAGRMGSADSKARGSIK